MRRLDERTLVGGQIHPAQIPALAAEGVTMIVNNRPDHEEPGQPLAAEIEAAAAGAGLAYRFIPIARGIGPSDIDAMAEAIAGADGPLLAFCRSGTRSALTWALAQRRLGRDSSEIAERLASAGFDPAPIAHLL